MSVSVLVLVLVLALEVSASVCFWVTPLEAIIKLSLCKIVPSSERIQIQIQIGRLWLWLSPRHTKCNCVSKYWASTQAHKWTAVRQLASGQLVCLGLRLAGDWRAAGGSKILRALQ